MSLTLNVKKIYRYQFIYTEICGFATGNWSEVLRSLQPRYLADKLFTSSLPPPAAGGQDQAVFYRQWSEAHARPHRAQGNIGIVHTDTIVL